VASVIHQRHATRASRSSKTRNEEKIRDSRYHWDLFALGEVLDSSYPYVYNADPNISEIPED
jgi:hypothetical protein